ncbi:amidohydrolase family protein [Sediminibacillus massiliensis]|uniref:amidohydrolase family protein n=1 Tax=Sediminibacillus massiliensis TaxID=1926277 RepID=UPI0009883DD0|nr:amidohydrolase family protein [Sediminibacillus massiliensis]
MRIDAHQHFWQIERGDYGWITKDMVPLYRDYLPGDLLPELYRHHIDGTVLIQAASTYAETEYMLDLYWRNSFIKGVVGWIDLDSPEFDQDFQRLKDRKGLVGFRPILESVERELEMDSPRVLKNIETLVQEDFPIDLLLVPRLLPLVLKLLKRFPTLRGVVNHAAKPYIKEEIFDPWREQIAEIASYSNTMCKLSGFITEADENWEQSDIEPYIHHVINVFGYESIMYGSDWPVCNMAGSYQDVYQVLVDSLPNNLSEADKEKLFGGNAIKFYKNLRG